MLYTLKYMSQVYLQYAYLESLVYLKTSQCQVATP